MIMALFVIVTAFLWLLHETDCLRVRLPVGETEPVKRESWEVLKRIAESIPERQKPYWLKHPESPPICGWNWIETTMHVVPECKIQLISETARYTIRSQNAAALRDAFRVYRNPYLKVKLT